MGGPGRRRFARSCEPGDARLPIHRLATATDLCSLGDHAARTPRFRAPSGRAFFLALGIVVSAYLGYVVLANPVEVIRHKHGLEYVTVVQHPMVWAVLYIIAVIAPALVSRYHSIVAFGVLNLVGLILVAIYYTQEFASLWCIFAGLSSILMLVHMLRRRSLPEADRRQDSPELIPA